MELAEKKKKSIMQAVTTDFLFNLFCIEICMHLLVLAQNTFFVNDDDDDNSSPYIYT